MRIKIIIFLLMFGLINCQNDADSTKASFNKDGKTIIERISPPQGYQWVNENSNSFGEFLQNLNLKQPNSPVLNFKGTPIFNQSNHVAVIDYDIGNRDLQQCADAIIRLHAEYLYGKGDGNKIQYQFTNGDVFKWDDYKNGIRPNLINNNTIDFVRSAKFNDSYDSFRKYLDIIFMYAGTISLNNETKPILRNSDIKTGDMIITPGSPGHAVIIVGHAKNKDGKSVYLLAQGFTPAQSIHVIKNPSNASLSPWYELDVSKSPTRTAGYLFNKTNIRSFRD